MDIDYRDTGRGAEVAARTEALLKEVLPREREWLGGRDARGDSDRQAEGEALVEELREEARARDVFAPQLPGEHGGLGLAFEELLPVFEQAGRSILGTRAMHVAAPDEGNIQSLELAGTAAQKEQ